MNKKLIDWWSGGASYDSDYQAWLTQIIADGGTQPSASVKTAQNALVLALKAASLWTRGKAGWFHHCGDLTTGRRNIFSPSTFRATVVNSPNFTEGQGIQSAASGYLNTTYNVNQYAGIETDLTIVQYIFTSSTSLVTQSSFGCRAVAGDASLRQLRPFSFGGNGQFANYSATLTGFTQTNHRGLYVTTYDGTNSVLYKNGTKTSLVETPVAPTLTQPFFILAKNASGSATELYTTGFVSFTMLFNRFTDSDESTLRGILNTYISACSL